MMKIKLQRNCAIQGQHCEQGEVVDVSEQDGTYLVNVGIAKLADDKAKVKKNIVQKTKIVMNRRCMVAGEHCEIGDMILALAEDARFLIAHGHAFKDGSGDAKKLKATLKKEASQQEKPQGFDEEAVADEGA